MMWLLAQNSIPQEVAPWVSMGVSGIAGYLIFWLTQRFAGDVQSNSQKIEALRAEILEMKEQFSAKMEKMAKIQLASVLKDSGVPITPLVKSELEEHLRDDKK